MDFHWYLILKGFEFWAVRLERKALAHGLQGSKTHLLYGDIRHFLFSNSLSF